MKSTQSSSPRGMTCSAPSVQENAERGFNDTVNEADKSWLVNTPARDVNFKIHLQFASVATVRAALETVIAQANNKSKVNVLERRLRLLRRVRRDFEAAKAAYLATR